MPEDNRADEALVTAYLSGETTAFDQIVNRYQERLIRFAQPITLNYEDAEDTVQETFLDIWQNIRRFEPTRKFSSWIYKLCRNRALKIVRKKHFKFEPLPAFNDPAAPEPGASAEDVTADKLRALDVLQGTPPEKWADWAAARETRFRILAVLNHRQYRLYDLVMVKGYTYELIIQEEKLFKDMTVDQLRDEFDRVLTIVWDRAEKEKEKWRGKRKQ
jgi:RNA polymerase sigma-70 factor (ECF subfamily)